MSERNRKKFGQNVRKLLVVRIGRDRNEGLGVTSLKEKAKVLKRMEDLVVQ
jgi:hypothetical protein